MFYENDKMSSYFTDNAEPNPLQIMPAPPMATDSERFPSRISSKFVCNTLFRPPARIFHPVMNDDLTPAYEALLEDYDNSECYCGASTEEYIYFGDQGFVKDIKPSAPGDLSGKKK